MEYLEGESLSEALIRRGPLPAQEAAQVIAQAAKALAKAHAARAAMRVTAVVYASGFNIEGSPSRASTPVPSLENASGRTV
jgi:hypothetical protein